MDRLNRISVRHHRVVWWLLTGVIALSFVFLFQMLIYDSCMQKSEEMERTDVYGSWQTAVLGADMDTINDVKTHATVQSYGVSQFFGNVWTTEGEQLPKIGFVDEKTMAMEPIKLMQGRFPAAADEAAVELSYLTSLGASPELDQTISLKVIVTDARTREEKEVFKELKVCGIIQDYSRKMKGTSLDKRDYVSFFISRDNDLTQYQAMGNLVMQMKVPYADNCAELSHILGDNGQLIENNYTYFNLLPESDYQMSVEELKQDYKLMGIILLFSLVSAGFVWYYIRNQKATWFIYKSLGATIPELKRRVLQQVLHHLLLGLLLGSVLGVLLSRLIYQLAVQVGHYSGVWSISIHELIKWSLLDLMGMFAAITAGAAIYCEENPILNFIRAHRKKKADDGKLHVDYKKMRRKFEKIYSGFQLGVCLASAAFLLAASLMACYVYDREFDYQYVKETRTADYEFGSLFNLYDTQKHISEDDFQKINAIYGMRYVEALKSIGYLPMELIGNNKEQLESNYKQYQGFTLGVNPEGEASEYYMDEVDSGKVNRELFNKGEDVILYLPHNPENKEELAVYNRYFEESDYTPVQSASIKVGSELQVGNNMTVHVAGIITGFKNNIELGQIKKPFTVIGSYNFIHRLNTNHNTYEYLYMYTDKKVENNSRQTQSEVSNMKQGAGFYNNQELKDNYQRGYIKCLVLCLTSSFLFFCLLCIIKNFMWCNKKKYYQRIFSKYKTLSMDMERAKKRIMISQIKLEVICVVLSGVLLLCFRGFLRMKMMERNVEVDFVLIQHTLSTKWILKIPWNMLSIIYAFLILIDLIENMNHFRKCNVHVR
ncbi:MAG: hypothetical protein PHG16_06575 [Lachnospiraceae bacterium]|nr:hypothetical protein [Lachnospiraceae bacterium]